MASHAYSPAYENSWALVVGINEYSNVGRLGYATNDAREFAKTIIDKFHFPRENVTLLLDKDATLERIRKELHSLVPKTGADDRVIVFYAGHGHTVTGRRGETGFLVPMDGVIDDTATLLPWGEFVQTADRIQAKHMLFIMDACYGGLIGTRGVQPGSSRVVTDMLTRYSRQFLTAGKANEVVADAGGPRLGHSVFTGHLLDALDGLLPAPNGVLSVNALMAHVYHHVAHDPHSRQAPHFGFLDGDGDLYLALPNPLPQPTDGKTSAPLMADVPADLDSPDTGPVKPSTAEQLKLLLPDPAQKIRLNDAVRAALRDVKQQLGNDKFPLHASTITAASFSETLRAYETAMREVLDVSVLLGRWTTPEQRGLVAMLPHTLAGDLKIVGGLTFLIALRHYPMLLSMYACGIGAIEGENYAALQTLFTTEVPGYHKNDMTASLVATWDAMAEIASSGGFKLIVGHERKHTPLSEYLFGRVQPIIDDHLSLGHRYEVHFDRYEVFQALSYAHMDNGSWGHAGRFAWKYRSRTRSDNPFDRIVEEAKAAGDAWAPLRAGMFAGTFSRFSQIAERYRTDILHQLNWY